MTPANPGTSPGVIEQGTVQVDTSAAVQKCLLPLRDLWMGSWGVLTLKDVGGWVAGGLGKISKSLCTIEQP